MSKKLIVDNNLECPYLFEMDGERYKFTGCKTWGEAEWAKKAWDEAVAKTLKAVGERIEHCDEIRDPDKNEDLIYYGVKPKMVGDLKQGRMPE